MNKVKIIFTVFLFTFSGICLYAQRYADIGIITGGSYYMGDINNSKHFYKPSFCIGGIYRYSLNYHHAFRINGIYTGLLANDLDFSPTPNHLQGIQPGLEAKLIDIAVNWEFNFLKYRTTDTKNKFSPYVTAGLGYAIYLSSSVGTTNHLIIPFGVGIKYNLTNRLSTGVEWVFRKTFNYPKSYRL